MSIITLTTDFGCTDAYVAAMKGVILSINPEATIVDVTHDVPPQDILHGAFVLSTAYGVFPPGTVHVAVVDPDVGTARKALGVCWKGHRFVAPDNGILSLALGLELPTGRELIGSFDVPLPSGAVANELSDARYHCREVSATFHGRDIFAPVAAHLTLGVPLSSMGPVLQSLGVLAVPTPSVDVDGTVRGMIVHIDGYGNAVTNIRRDQVRQGDVEIHVGQQVLRCIQTTFRDASGPLALWGSFGCLEIAVSQGNAARELGLERWQTVLLRPAR